MELQGSATLLDRRIRRAAATLEDFAADERGQGLVEYALLILLVALAAIGTLTLLGTTLDDTIQTVVDAFP